MFSVCERSHPDLNSWCRRGETLVSCVWIAGSDASCVPADMSSWRWRGRRRHGRGGALCGVPAGPLWMTTSPFAAPIRSVLRAAQSSWKCWRTIASTFVPRHMAAASTPSGSEQKHLGLFIVKHPDYSYAPLSLVILRHASRTSIYVVT